MKTRKWLSNSSEVLTKIPQELRAYEINLKDSLPTAKTLGILWRAPQDVLTFQAKKLPEGDKLTKRIILSKVAGGFDPLGLAGPFVVCAKILLQEMWTKGLDWDEPIDHELSSRQVIGKHSSRQVIEKHGVGNMNSNGLMVLEFCSRYQLCVMGTMFQMKNSLKTTWQHLRSKHFHQIDHVLANTRAKQYINVTKIYPNADCFTDHKLLTSNCIFRIQRKKKGLKPPKKFDITLTSEKIQRLQLFLDEKLPDCRHDWEDFKMTLQDAAKHTFDQKKKVSNDWFDDQGEEIQRLLKDKQLNRNELRDRVRLLKNQWFHERATEAERYAQSKNHREFYASINKIYGPRSKTTHPVRSKDGAPLTSSPDIKERWVELPNQPTNVDASLIDNIEQLQIDDSLDLAITEEELDTALKSTKLRKSPGSEGVLPEVLVHG